MRKLFQKIVGCFCRKGKAFYTKPRMIVFDDSSLNGI